MKMLKRNLFLPLRHSPPPLRIPLLGSQHTHPRNLFNNKKLVCALVQNKTGSRYRITVLYAVFVPRHNTKNLKYQAVPPQAI